MLCIVFGGFFIFGLSENIRGPAFPEIQAAFRLGEAQLGLLMAVNSLGYFIACTFTFALVNKIGMKRTGTLMFSLMAASGWLICLSASYPILTGSYFLLYIGTGMLEIALGILAARIFTANTGTMMNLSHFFYGLGSTVAPMAAVSVMGWPFAGGELGWRGMYAVILSLSLLLILPVLAGQFSSDRQNQADRLSFGQLARDPDAWLIVAVLSFGVIAEIAIGNWLVYYLEKVYGWSVGQASAMLALYFFLFMLARLFLGPLTDRLGYALSVILCSAFAGLCSLTALLSGEKAAVLFAVAGIGIAPIYPTIMALIAKKYANGTDTAVTFTVTLMGIGSILGQYGIGWLIDAVKRMSAPRGALESLIIGLQSGYAAISLMALLGSLCCILLYARLRKRNNTV